MFVWKETKVNEKKRPGKAHLKNQLFDVSTFSYTNTYVVLHVDDAASLLDNITVRYSFCKFKLKLFPQKPWNCYILILSQFKRN